MTSRGIPASVLLIRMRHELRTLELQVGSESVSDLKSLVEQLEETITREK